jgi:glycosyltransferase involved in cell wall biosynthesis
MKIAQIASPWIAVPPTTYGGTESVLYNLIEEQIAQGHDVTLFAPGDARTSARHISFFDQSLVGVGVPWQAHLKAFYHHYKAVEYIKAHSFDITHIHLSSASDMYLYPLLHASETPVISTLHSRFPFDRVDGWCGDADDCYLEWLASVPLVVISESALADVPYQLNFLDVIHHGLPLKRIVPTTERPDGFFVWLGRLFPVKGAHLAIEAARKAGEALVLAGTIDQHMSESVDYFERMIRPQLDDQQIRYIGPVGTEQKIDLLSRARGLLNPIQWNEPFGMVMAEAMAVGCPVISFVRGAASELVCHGESGFLVHDVNEMVNYMSKVGTLDRQKIREYMEKHFSVEKMVDKYIHAYRKVITEYRSKNANSHVSLQIPISPMSVFLTPEMRGCTIDFCNDSLESGDARGG